MAPQDRHNETSLPPWRRTLDDGAPYWTKNYQPGVPVTIDLPTESLVALLDEACAQGGDKVATQFFDAEMTYRQLGERVARAAEGLRKLGVGPGDRVAVLLPNCPQHLIAFYAIVRLGAVIVEHNPLYTPSELQGLFASHGARFAIVMDSVVDKLTSMPNYARPTTIISVNLVKAMPLKLRAVLALPLPAIKAKRALLSSGTRGTLSWEELLRSRPLRPSHPRPGLHDLAAIQYTSGTSGTPRGAMLTHYNLFANARQGRAWMYGAEVGKETSYAALPLFHAFGITVHMTFGVLMQARQVLFPKPDVDMIVEAARKHPPTIYCAVPALYQRTAEVAAQRGVDLNSARFCISGAMALIDSTRETWERATGGLLVEGYGLSEASPIGLGNPFCTGRRSGTIGVPFPSTLMKVVRLDDPTREVAVGEPGELLIRGPQVFQGYWNDPDGTEEVLVDGWLCTGDMVTVDEDGFTTIVDRKKEIIITGGFNVSPSEVEKAMIAHPAIDDIAVIGLPRASGDDEVTAAVVLAEGASLDTAEVIAWAKQRLAAYKVPRRYEVMDELPKSMLGKVLRRKVAERILGQ